MKYHSRSRAFSLTEILLVLAVITAATIGVWRLMGATTDHALGQKEQGNLAQLVSNVRGVYTSSANFNGLSVSSIPDGAFRGVKTNAQGQPTSTFGAPITLEPASVNQHNDAFEIVYHNLDKNQCVALIPPSAAQAWSVTVGGDSVRANGAPLDEAKLASACDGPTFATRQGVVGFTYLSNKRHDTTASRPSCSATCTARKETKNFACPSGQSGFVRKTRQVSCVTESGCPAEKTSAWTVEANTCAPTVGNGALPGGPDVDAPKNACVPHVETRTVSASCPSGESGSMIQTNTVTCKADGTAVKSGWTNAITQSQACVPASKPKGACVPHVQMLGVKSCAAIKDGGQLIPQFGSIQTAQNWVCNDDGTPKKAGGVYEISNTCAPAPGCSMQGGNWVGTTTGGKTTSCCVPYRQKRTETETQSCGAGYTGQKIITKHVIDNYTCASWDATPTATSHFPDPDMPDSVNNTCKVNPPEEPSGACYIGAAAATPSVSTPKITYHKTGGVPTSATASFKATVGGKSKTVTLGPNKGSTITKVWSLDGNAYQSTFTCQVQATSGGGSGAVPPVQARSCLQSCYAGGGWFSTSVMNKYYTCMAKDSTKTVSDEYACWAGATAGSGSTSCVTSTYPCDDIVAFRMYCEKYPGADACKSMMPPLPGGKITTVGAWNVVSHTQPGEYCHGQGTNPDHCTAGAPISSYFDIPSDSACLGNAGYSFTCSTGPDCPSPYTGSDFGIVMTKTYTCKGAKIVCQAMTKATAVNDCANSESHSCTPGADAPTFTDIDKGTNSATFKATVHGKSKMVSMNSGTKTFKLDGNYYQVQLICGDGMCSDPVLNLCGVKPPPVIATPDLTGLPGSIIDSSTPTPASAVLILSPDGSFAAMRGYFDGSTFPSRGETDGEWLTFSGKGEKPSNPGNAFEAHVSAKTSWATKITDAGGGGGGIQRTVVHSNEDTSTGWFSLGEQLIIALPNNTTSSTSESNTGVRSVSYVTLTIRQKSDHSKQYSATIRFESGGGCFAQDMQIMLADGKWTTFGNLKLGQKVMGFVDNGKGFKVSDLPTLRLKNLDGVSLVPSTVENASAFYEKGGISINGIKSTRHHDYFVHGKAYRFEGADDVSMSDTLVGIHKQDVPVKSIHTFGGKTKFVSVATSTGTFIVRSGPKGTPVLVHNWSGGARAGPDPNPLSINWKPVDTY